MIRILHVVSSLNINAGMMSVIMNYYRNIDRSEIQFDFLYFSEMEETHQAEIEQLGGRTFLFPYELLKPAALMQIKRFFQDHKGEYTAVHCHPIWSSSFVSHAAKRSGINHVIQHAHSTKFSENRISSIRNRFLMTFVGMFATDYIACNDEAKKLFGRLRTRNGNIFVLPNAIDVDQYSFDEEMRKAIRDEFNVEPSTIIIGSVGRFSPEKNQCFLVEVFKAIHDLIPNSKLILVGDGSYRKEVEHRIKELELENEVLLTGKRRDIKAVLSGFDLFMMTSIFEGTPVSALEARTSGLPCLLSDTITRSIEMEGMRYLPINETPERWAEEALKLITEWKTHDRHDCIEVVKHGFDIKIEAKKLQDYYLKLR